MKRNEMRKGNSRMIAVLTAVMMLLSAGGVNSIAKAEGEPICGLAEHTHTDACFDRVLVCTLEESEAEYVEGRHFVSNFQTHIHTDKCKDSEGNIICGIAEDLYFHEHNEYCYDEEGNLCAAWKASRAISIRMRAIPSRSD